MPNVCVPTSVPRLESLIAAAASLCCAARAAIDQDDEGAFVTAVSGRPGKAALEPFVPVVAQSAGIHERDSPAGKPSVSFPPALARRSRMMPVAPFFRRSSSCFFASLALP